MTDRMVLSALLALAVAWVPGAAAADEAADTVPASSIAVLTDETEPGQPLRIDGRVVNELTGEPIEGAAVVVYQTDDGGEYEPADPDDETTARLNGAPTTDADGRFLLHTILPGEYPGAPTGNRHIHVREVTAEGYAPSSFVILFDDNVNAEVRAWAGQTGFGMVIEVQDEDGLLTGSIEISLAPAFAEPSPSPGGASARLGHAHVEACDAAVAELVAVLSPDRARERRRTALPRGDGTRSVDLERQDVELELGQRLLPALAKTRPDGFEADGRLIAGEGLGVDGLRVEELEQLGLRAGAAPHGREVAFDDDVAIHEPSC